MSNKTKTTTLEPAGKPALTPKLRFPEFQNAGEWEKKRFSGVIDLISGMHLSPDEYSTTGEVPYFTGPSDFTNELSSVTKWTKRTANVSQAEDTLITVKGSGVGEIWYSTLPEVAMGRQLMAVRTKNGASRFMFQFLLTKRLRFEDLGSGNLIPGLSRAVILELEACFPTPPEQQRIADCLTTLDDLIAAQARKLDALKTHKKGLMQQLFPREGETQPRLRFPEFQAAGEWREKLLGDMCLLVRGPFGGSLKKEIFMDSGYAVYEQSHAIYGDFTSFRYYIPELKYTELKRFSVKPGDIIMSCSGTMGKFAIVPIDASLGVINQALLKLSVRRGCIPLFLKHVLELPTNQEQLLSQSAGGAIKNVVSVSQIKELELFIPSLAEQQRIVDCLSTLDDLLATQIQKLKTLENHKKGLMQQLFPSPEEVEA